ncbi:MAG: sigma-54 dependent transcriptional regulator [Pirellulales bacterium]|nr:sigma-54 dependent transcriptional regulator [Pirellulales bacterium]
MSKPRLLIVDEPAAREAYQAALNSLGGAEAVFESRDENAIRRLREEPFDLLIARIEPPAQGFELLREGRAADPALPVILVASTSSVETATRSLRAGASDYLAQPWQPDELVAAARRLLAERRREQEHELLRRQVERPYSFDELIGTSPAMQAVYRTIEQVADSDVPVLVIGETGTGKELVARSIHRRSRRAAASFVPVDCGAIPESLLESEFFGHERGTFTGAEARRIGLLEFADGGTFFLDELGELPLLMQAKLLRTLQEKQIRRVGGREQIDVDVRIVAATGRDLEAMVATGEFRQDLYYRINVVRIDLPPLRQRGDDVGLLAEFFANRYSREMQRSQVGITPEAYQVLSQYPWPGNVRELQNVIRRALALSHKSMIGLEDLPDGLVEQAGRRSGGAARTKAGDSVAVAPAAGGFFAQRDAHVAQFEHEYLTALLRKHHGDVKSAALEAQIPRGTLYRLMKNLGLDGNQFRASAELR